MWQNSRNQGDRCVTNSGSARGEWRLHWPLVLAATAGVMVSAVSTGSIGVFMGPLEQEFGWSRTEISSGPALVSFIAMALATAMGFAIDRFGPRLIGIAAAALMCGAIALMSTVSGSIWHWWALWAIAGLAAACMPTVWLAPLGATFSASRGLALAVTLSGTGLTNAVVPLIAHWFVENHGWRAGYLGLGAIWTVLALPLLLLFFRGKVRPRSTAANPLPADHLPGLTVREGFRSAAFYRLGLAAFLSTVAGVALILNLFPVLVSTGISRGDAAWLAGLLGIATITGRLLGGWLLDHFSAGLIAALSAVLAIGLPAALLVAPGSVTGAVLGVGLYGLVGGAKIPAIAYLAGKHLGQRAFGTLYGTISACVALSVALGPVAANLIYDATKSYDLVMWAAVPALLLAGVFYATLGAYPDFAAARKTGTE